MFHSVPILDGWKHSQRRFWCSTRHGQSPRKRWQSCSTISQFTLLDTPVVAGLADGLDLVICLSFSRTSTGTCTGTTVLFTLVVGMHSAFRTWSSCSWMTISFCIIEFLSAGDWAHNWYGVDLPFIVILKGYHPSKADLSSFGGQNAMVVARGILWFL